MSTTISGTNGVTFPDSTSMQTGQQACKAWVNFNGTGTVAIRGSYNVSSITDRGTGLYTMNFTNAMANTNYSVIGQAWYAGVQGALFGIEGTPTSTTSKEITVLNTAASAVIDVTYVSVTVFSN